MEGPLRRRSARPKAGCREAGLRDPWSQAARARVPGPISGRRSRRRRAGGERRPMSTPAGRTFHLTLCAASMIASVVVAGCQMERLDATYLLDPRADGAAGGGGPGVPIAGLHVSGSQIVDAMEQPI